MPAHSLFSRLSLVRLGNPVLRTKAKRVPLSYLKTKEFLNLKKQLLRVMRSTGGVGLAAPQLGVSLRVAVLETRPTETRPELTEKGPLFIINPRVISFGKSLAKDWEGCLSFRPLRGQVRRSRSITVEYWNEEGVRIEEKMNGLWARIFQHEVDHLDGVIYVDRVEDTKSLMELNEFKERIVGKKS